MDPGPYLFTCQISGSVRSCRQHEQDRTDPLQDKHRSLIAIAEYIDKRQDADPDERTDGIYDRHTLRLCIVDQRTADIASPGICLHP